MEPALWKVHVQYIEAETGNVNGAYALTVGAHEAQEYGFAFLVVNNKELILPTLDGQNKLVSWSKVGFQRIDTDAGSSTTFYEFKIRESDLENLIGMSVGG